MFLAHTVLFNIFIEVNTHNVITINKYRDKLWHENRILNFHTFRAPFKMYPKQVNTQVQSSWFLFIYFFNYYVVPQQKTAKSYSFLSLPRWRLILNNLGPALFCQIKYAQTKIELSFFSWKNLKALSFNLFHLGSVKVGCVFIQ